MPNMSIRLSDDEYRQIHEKAHVSGKTVSAYCRDVLLGHEIRDLLPRQEIGKIMCAYHNKVEDAKTAAGTKHITHEMEKKIWQCIK